MRKTCRVELRLGEWSGIKTKGSRGGRSGEEDGSRRPLTAREGGPKLTNPSTCSVCKGARDIDSRPPLPPTSCATCTREYNTGESWRFSSPMPCVYQVFVVSHVSMSVTQNDRAPGRQSCLANVSRPGNNR